VKLLSADPRDVPDINFNFFKDGAAHDLQALREGVEFARRIFNETKSDYGPFTNVQPPDGADTEESIMQEAYSHHAACSCPMGPAGDAGACVDSRFRVQGVDNLRVVDASIFPRIPGAFPILPVFMISEKAFDAIMEDGKNL
jgi:choline dehydrogenase